ncbi:MAG: tetratricopeptide repeat protein [Bacteroidales bacterium]|nr:tetratricopeptide repeat protein [Bacteroidales bacterium]
MTVPEVSKLYERIIYQILHLNLREAFSNLGYLIQLNGFGLAYDQLTEMETNYRYMLKYRLEGYPDPEREKVSLNLQKKAMELTDESFHLWMTKNSSDFYYDRIRIDRVSGGESLPQLLQDIRQSGEKQMMIELVEDAESKTVQMLQVARFRERATVGIFYKVWISTCWKRSDFAVMDELFKDSALFDYEKSLIVSAILLSLQKRMDHEKMILLIDLCFHEQPEISQRALVVLVLSLYQYDERLTFYPEIIQRLAVAMENQKFQESMVRVFYQLIRSKDTENVTKRMQEEILPEMTKFGSTIQDKMRNGEGDDQSDEFNPDWKHMMENTEFSVKMQEFSDMQLEGIDVYMSTFSGQKNFSFFQEMANWFLPFYPSHSSLSDLFETNRLEGTSVLDAVLKSDYLCSSDKYSFCFNILQIPASYRSAMSAQLGADSEAYEEIKKTEMGLNSQFKLEQASNRYIQDLYRFFNLFNRKHDFINVFSLPLDLHNTKSLGVYLKSENALRRIGLLYFKNKNFNQALAVLDLLLAIHPTDAELHQKRGYCLQQLNQKSLALDAYLQADLIQPDSLWTLKRIAASYRHLKNPAKALEYYKRAESLDPDNIILTLNIGHCLVELEDFAEALNYYFKAELLSEGSPKTWRPIAWCSFICKKYDQAGKYYEKILQNNPQINDYLNAGHLEWCKGFPKQAMALYKRGIHATQTLVPDFLELFRKDADELVRQGIHPDDIASVRDELLYELEE